MCYNVEVTCFFRNVVTPIATVLKIDEVIQTGAATLANIKELKSEQEECKCIHQGQRHCFFTANGVWGKANISACTISGKVGSIVILPGQC